MIRLTVPGLADAEVEATSRVLRSGMLVQGPEVARFEERIAERCARAHAMAVTNGTAALELALRALGIGPGDEVIVPDVTWPSPAHAVLQVGATPVLIDVDAAEWNAVPDAYRAAVSPATRGAIAIDQFGMPARLSEIVAALPGVSVIEDAACAIGSTRAEGPCGKGSVISTLSFHPRKVLVTGEGGMCLTDDAAIAERIRILRNHGQRSVGEFACASGNMRMTEVAAAIGLVQLDRLDGMLTQRRHLAARYHAHLKHVVFQKAPENALSNWQTFGVLLPAGKNADDRDRVVAALRTRDVEAGRLSYALHRLAPLQAAAESAKSKARAFTCSEQIVDRGFALPLYASMDDETQDRVINALEHALAEVIQ
ncbi:MAG: DegT/DnrJ/EryC1/StrS family aminotransferase [Sandaracinaceae bacterium]|nr:DegT/DnrJ/EryC1/StrS family aminotransferase [Sandaracinaceae bacterium]